MDPTIDPAPDAEEPGSSTPDSVEVNADEDEATTHKVTIKDYRTVLDSATIAATVGGTDAEISNNGEITVELAKGETSKTLALTVTAKRHRKVKSVESGETKGTISGDNGSLSLTITKDTADAEVTITTVETYDFTLDDDDATGITLQRLVTNAEGKTVKEAFGTGTYEKDGEALQFVTSYTANNDSLTVSYAADGEDDETPLTGELQDDPTSDTGKPQVVIYTIPSTALADLDELAITLVKNEQVAVTFEANDKVEVQLWGEKTPASGDTAAAMDWIAVPAAGYKVIAGEKAKFKAVAKDPYTITAVKANTGADGVVEKISDPSTNGEYEFTVTKATEFSFDTEYDSNKSKTLTFKLDGDKGSATAKITGVTLKATTTGGADTVLSADTTPTLADFLTGLGLTNGELEVGKGVKIPNTVAKIKVEVTAVAANGYDLAKINNTDVTADEKAAGKAEKEIAYDSIGDWTVTTAAKKSAGDTFFKIVLPEAVKHIKLDTGAATGENATVSAVADVANTYKVKSGTDTVSITMTADEGWVLDSTFETALKAVAGVADVKSEVKDKKTVYTVKLLATKLDATANGASATDLGTIAEAVLSFTAEVDAETSSKAGYVEGAYKVTPVEAFPADGAANETNIPYNAKLETTITADEGYTLTGVTLTMGGVAQTSPEILKVSGVDTAKIEIEKVTGDVKIKVETAEAYDIRLSAATGSDTDEPDQPGWEKGDETWAVKYNGKYAIDVSPAVDIKDLSAEIKDGSTIIGRGKKIGGELQLWMNRAWAGKELTVDVKAKDVKIGELVLQVNKKRSTLAVKAEGTIKQDVASTAVYEIETDGEKLPDTVVPDVTGDLSGKVTAAINEKGNLEIVVKPAKFADVNTVATTGSGDDAVRTVTPKTATITITDPEDNTLKAKATVQANAVFDTVSKPSVSLVDGGASDTDLVVNVGMDSVIAPKKGPSKVYYVITADAKPDTAKTDTTEESKRDQDKLKDTITKVVERKGSSQRVTLDVGKANLGDGAAWDYDVTARVVYALDGAKPSDSVKAAAVAAGANSDISALSDKLETSTVDTLFEAGLKLKKDGKKKPASTLYTGQENLYIATPQWSKKNVNYKIAEAEVVDLAYHYYNEDGELRNYGGVNAEINDAGDLVVTSVDTDAYLGKHTLQVTAKADMTAGHTMYASRATITVNVVKGINDLDVYVPGNQIFKQNNKAATYKATVEYDYAWNNNKKVYPKSKKVKWSVVGADSEGSYDGDIDNFTLTAAPAGITIKNGTVTVAKNFTVDARHPQNNAFRVLVQADDFAGNKTADLSSTVYITDKALDVSNIIIASENEEKGGYDVIAVKEGTKSAKAQDVKAEDIDDAKVYAAAKTVAPGFVSDAKWNTLDVVDEWNLTYAPAKGNVLTVDSNGWIDVKTPGKKATITVTAQDGSKKKNSIALNMGYTPVDSTAALKITAYDAQNEGKKVEVTKAPTKEADAAAKVEKDFALPGVVELDVEVYVAQRDDKGAFKKFEEINDYSNYKLTVSGGKYVNGTIYSTAKKTTLNLTVGAGKEAKKYSYVLTNTAYDAAGKAKVTVKNALHTWGSEEEQKVKMTALNGKDSFGDNKYVKVELDQTAWPKYNSNPGANNDRYYAWRNFNNRIRSHYIKLDKVTGEFDLEFADVYYDGGVSLAAGSYKLKVTVGTGATAAAFKADTQPVNVTVKVNKNKAFTFKPVTSYTINKVDGGAVLTGKANVNVKAGEKVRVDFYNLQNANVNGKSNLFTHYFKLEEDKVTGTVRLTLNTEDPLVEKLMYETKEDGTVDKNKPIADPDLSALSKDKKNLTGYVTYYAEPSVNYYDWEGEKTVKITVKIAPEAKNNKYKATQKYNPESGTEIGLKKGNKTEVNILVNGAYVSVAHAIIDDSKAKSNAAELTNVTVNAKGQIVLEAASDLDPEKKGGYTTNLLIVPAASYYADAITGTTKAEDKKALIERYGIPVKVTVAAKEKPKATPDPTAPKRPSEPSDPAEKTLTGALAIADAVDFTSITIAKSDASTLDATAIAAAETAIQNAVMNALDAQGYGSSIATYNKTQGLTIASGNATATLKYTLTVGDETSEPQTVTISAVTTAKTIATQIPAKLASYQIAYAKWTAGSGGEKGTIDASEKATILAAITGIDGQDDFTIEVKSITVTTDPVSSSTDGKADVVITVTKDSDTADTESIEVAIANS